MTDKIELNLETEIQPTLKTKEKPKKPDSKKSLKAKILLVTPTKFIVELEGNNVRISRNGRDLKVGDIINL